MSAAAGGVNLISYCRSYRSVDVSEAVAVAVEPVGS